MKTLTVLVALVSVSAVTQAQTSGKFNLKYLPNQTYNLSAKTDLETEIKITKVGINDSTSQAGPKRSLLWKVRTEAAGAVKTAAENASKSLPFTMTCSKSSTKMSVNGIEAPAFIYNPAQGDIINGIIDANIKLHPDTSTAPQAVKSAIAPMIGGMPLQKMAFPVSRMKIGAAFTQEEPLTLLDVPGINLNKDYTMKVTYKLTAIKDNMAYFDISSVFDMDINTQAANGHKVTGKGRGSGTGKMVFNIAKNFPESITNDKRYTLGLESTLTKVDVNVKMNSQNEYDLSAK